MKEERSNIKLPSKFDDFNEFSTLDMEKIILRTYKNENN